MCSDSERPCSKSWTGDQEPAGTPGRPAEVSGAWQAGTGPEAGAGRWPVSGSMKMKGDDGTWPGAGPAWACILGAAITEGSMVKVF